MWAFFSQHNSLVKCFDLRCTTGDTTNGTDGDEDEEEEEEEEQDDDEGEYKWELIYLSPS